jgi:uncharacterized metal-binding protein YceD (DUF177 family)
VTTKHLLSRPVDVARIHQSGLAEHIEASAAERLAIAGDHKLIAVDALSADLAVDRGPGGAIVVDGRVKAEVVHTCVVSLEPVPQSIDEPVHATFAGAGSAFAPPAPKPGAEVMVDPDADVPQPIDGPSIDLGALVLEHFTLALDPYPRAPGAELPAAVGADQAATRDSPFAALAKLAGPKG